MKLPKRLQQQLRLYQAEGFRVEEVSRASRHYKVKFLDVPTPQFLTANAVDPRAYLNNIARLKRQSSKKEAA
jgi:hypothetical protein